jgi:hypothetical protein
LEEAERLDVVLKTAKSKFGDLVDLNRLKEIVEKYEATKTLSESELIQSKELKANVLLFSL